MTAPALPDVASGILDWLKATFAELADGVGETDRHVGSNPWPLTDIEARVPFVAVQVVGGSAGRLGGDIAVDIDTFGPDRASSYALAEAIRARISVPGNKSGVVIDRAFARLVPSKAPWENPRVFRTRATYDLSVRAR